MNYKPKGNDSLKLEIDKWLHLTRCGCVNQPENCCHKNWFDRNRTGIKNQFHFQQQLFRNEMPDVTDQKNQKYMRYERMTVSQLSKLKSSPAMFWTIWMEVSKSFDLKNIQQKLTNWKVMKTPASRLKTADRSFAVGLFRNVFFKCLVYTQGKTVKRTPNYKSETGAVPQTAEQHGRHLVEIDIRSFFSIFWQQYRQQENQQTRQTQIKR